jgi:arylformamidase
MRACCSACQVAAEFRKSGRFIGVALDRRAFVTATAASVAAPTVVGAKEVANAGMDWITMSLEARNLAYNNGAHVGAEAARKKTEEWTEASNKLRAQRPQHLNLAYAPGERTKWDLYPATDSKAPCFVHIHGGYWQRNSREIFACLAEGALARGWSAALPGYTLPLRRA